MSGSTFVQKKGVRVRGLNVPHFRFRLSLNDALTTGPGGDGRPDQADEVRPSHEWMETGEGVVSLVNFTVNCKTSYTLYDAPQLRGFGILIEIPGVH